MADDPFAQYAAKPAKDDPFAQFAAKPADSGVPPPDLIRGLTSPHNISDSPDPIKAPSHLDKLNAALDAPAHPKNWGDMGGLLIPSGGAEVVGKALAPVGRLVKRGAAAASDMIGGAVGIAANATLPSAITTPAKALIKGWSALNPAEWNSPLTVAGREGRAQNKILAFNQQPLTKQMAQLPETPAPVTTRGAAPPYVAPPPAPTPFHEQPLFKQMEQLPDKGPMPMGRLATRPFQPPQPAFNDKPLYQQMQEMGEPLKGPLPDSTRTAMPPYKPPPPASAPPAEAPKVPETSPMVEVEPFQGENQERLKGPVSRPKAPPSPVKVQPDDAGPASMLAKQNELGARDAAAKAGVSPDDLRNATGQRGKVPDAAQRRIDAYASTLTAKQIKEQALTTTNTSLRKTLLAMLEAVGQKPE